MYEQYTRVDYNKLTWLLVNNFGSPQAGAVNFAPENFQRSEDGVEANRLSIHVAKYVQVEDALREADPIDAYPNSTECHMEVTGWNGDGGVALTYRSESPTIGRQYLMSANGNDYRRVLLSESRTPWQDSTGYLVGDLAEPLLRDGTYYRVSSITGTGVSGIAEPIWDPLGGNVVDNEVTWNANGTYWSAWQTAQYV